ncbi:hypothetical protein [Thiohalobacter thiocyanaticus]|uniref:Uncharacterized protein n=1 Tax=Thiohalobacter thiocyanaticus TaxID=585455 RepID=A0A426QKQ9_9GAMM|nr:hypothetical protein [Thiohalobacter thiocyanaticus]RRQ22342.1 hypothetical protein D6C00_10535 [Thiohalobacter thiocyanaticus]
MRSHPLQLHRLLLIACLALLQLFVPLVHAHTGDSHQTGVHVHIFGADQDSDTPVLSADPGIEVDIEPMRRESGNITPGPDIPPLSVASPEIPACSVPGTPAGAPALIHTSDSDPDVNPPRGPPAAPLR